MKKTNGEGSIWAIDRKGKTYYMGAITIGFDNMGKPIRKTTGSYKKSKVIAKLDELKYQARHKLLSSNPTIMLGEVFKGWIYEYKKNEVQNNTFAEYEVCYRLRIEPYAIARVRMNDITLDILQRHFNELKAQGWSNNTIKKTYIKINACFEFALIHGIVNKNYCKGVVIGKHTKKKEDEYKVFTKEEQEQIINALDLRDTLDKVIYFTFYTGLRLGEVLAVKWENVQGNLLTIKAQYQKDVQIDKEGNRRTTYLVKDILKTKQSQREIPIPQRLIDLLEDTLKLGEFIFCDENGQPLEVKRVPRKLKKICKRLGLGEERTFHSVRHSYATRLFEMDIPIKTVQALLGHSEIQTTMNIYTHVMQDKKLEVLEKLDKM